MIVEILQHSGKSATIYNNQKANVIKLSPSDAMVVFIISATHFTLFRLSI